MSKARPKLSISAAPEPDPGLKITDTMTLVIKDEGGQELRVKDSGILPVSNNFTPRQQTPGVPTQPESVLGSIRFEDLRIGEVLGQGSAGKVRVVQHRETGEKFALKCMTFTEEKDAMRAMLQNELRQVTALKHPNIVSSYEAFFREGKLYIVLEFMDCGTMTSILKRLGGGMPEDKLSYIAAQFLLGLAFLHGNKVIHRDIKPANVLANSAGEVKISDFGVAKTFAADNSQNLLQTASAMGSTPYMSPERIQSQPYSFSCDIWSCGITIAECAIGAYPFGHLKNKVFELCQAIATNQAHVQWELAGGRQFTPELVDFVNQCLRPQHERPTALQLLEHPFLGFGRHLAAADVGQWFLRPTY